MKIAILGSGGREHAIAWKLCQYHNEKDIFCLPGNAGFANSFPVDISNFSEIEIFCREHAVELIIVGPEVPLVEGIVDFFEESSIKVFGPNRAASQLEGSKIWAKNFMKASGVATADFSVFDSPQQAEETIHRLDGNLVIKYDGLAAGKGVTVSSSTTEAFHALTQLQEKYGEHFPFLIEEKLSGEELSLVSITDGKTIRHFAPSQDHKRAFDHDMGPNTGGMGAFCPLPFWNESLASSIEKEIVQPTLKGLQRKGLAYRGVLYFGIMLTDSGPKLLEYNVRFGDPETEVILPALKSDLLEPILSTFDGTLEEKILEFHEGFFVDVVLTSGGYPGNYASGHKISGIDKLNEKTLCFHAGTETIEEEFLTKGGRVLNIVSSGKSLQEAIDHVYQECEKIDFKDIAYRKDIGRKMAIV